MTQQNQQHLAYDFHEDLLPVLAGLEAPLQGRGLRQGGELLLDEVFPLEEVGVGLEGGFPLVCGLRKKRQERRKRKLN